MLLILPPSVVRLLYSREIVSMVSRRPASPKVIEEASPVRPRYPSREVVKRITRQDRQIAWVLLLHVPTRGMFDCGIDELDAIRNVKE